MCLWLYRFHPEEAVVGGVQLPMGGGMPDGGGPEGREPDGGGPGGGQPPGP